MRAMMRRRTTLTCVTLVAAASIGVAAADDSPPPPSPTAATATVTGRILDASTQEGLRGVSIRILDDSEGGASLATELDGTYTLALAAGTYTIVISTPEYVEQRRTVTVGDAQAVALEVTLAPVPGR